MATPVPPPRQRDAATWQPGTATGRSPKGVHPTTSNALRALSATPTHLERAAVAEIALQCGQMAKGMLQMMDAVYLDTPPHQLAIWLGFATERYSGYFPGVIGSAIVTWTKGRSGLRGPPTPRYQTRGVGAEV